MMKVVHAEGALRRFLQARARGASEDELKALKAEADEARPPDRRNVIYFDGARRERLRTPAVGRLNLTHRN
jgi:hypothetical protein